MILNYQIVQQPGGWYLDLYGIGWILITASPERPTDEEVSFMLKQMANHLQDIAAELSEQQGASEAKYLITTIELA